MTSLRSLLVCLAAMLVAAPALASEEGALPLGTFRVESPGIGESGPVVVAGTQGAEGMRSFSIDAFGKHFELDAKQLKQLSGGFLNNVQLSYETGYKNLGGRTVYVVLAQGFTSGVVVRKYVTVTESGTIKVGEKP